MVVRTMTADVTTRPVAVADLPAISALHARAFGPGRFARTAYRVREGVASISRFCRLAEVAGEIVAAVRFTEVTVGGRSSALLLGPLVVEPACAGRGYGRGLVAAALADARAAGIALVVLVGDETYYERLGFKRVPADRIRLPGPADPDRILAAELEPGALARFEGVVAARHD
jgi:predicted N-acetyltransferase YhbS